MDSDDKKITQLAQVTSLSDSDLFVVAVDIGTAPKTKAIKKTDAIKGGLTVSSASVTTSNVTGVEGTLHNLDVSGMTANRDYNLPTPSAVGVRCAVRLSTGDATYALLLKINGSEWSRIFITGEIVIFVAIGTGAGDWAIEHDGRVPCVTRIKNTGAQSISNSTITVLTLDELEYDNASCANIGSNRIDVRRTNKYIMTGGLQLNSLDANTQRVFGAITKDAGPTYIVTAEMSGYSGAFVSLLPATTDALTVGSYIQLRVWHNSGSSEDTYVGTVPTHLEFTEVLT